MTTLPKWMIPRLLLQLMQEMDDKCASLLTGSFKGCGIHPFDPQHVLRGLTHENVNYKDCVSRDLLNYLKTTRETSVRHNRPRSKRLNIQPGQSVTLADFDASVSGTQREQPPREVSEDEMQPSDVADESSDVEDELERREESDRTDDTEEENDIVYAQADYVLVQFDCAKEPFHYVAKLMRKAGEEWYVTYYRKCEQNVAKGKSLTNSVAFNPFPAVYQ